MHWRPMARRAERVGITFNREEVQMVAQQRQAQRLGMDYQEVCWYDESTVLFQGNSHLMISDTLKQSSVFLLDINKSLKISPDRGIYCSNRLRMEDCLSRHPLPIILSCFDIYLSTENLKLGLDIKLKCNT